MTMKGILESLIATAIWFFLLHIYRKRKSDLEKKRAMRQKCLEIVKWYVEISEPSSPMVQEAYFGLGIFSQNMNKHLSFLYHQITIALFITIVLFVSMFQFESRLMTLVYSIVIVLFVIFIVALFFDIEKTFSLTDEFDSTIIHALEKKYRPKDPG